ncbi:LacI family DNA-binding transcriptional regulator [Bacteroides ovatus]|nr:LacI family DNA-binding transcriptional regulator [Bacteroides ovatus]
MKKTLIDVSKKTGYSISTISRVLNGKSEKYRISQSAKEVILQSVKELNYQPDIVAQSLRNNTTYTIYFLYHT